MGRCAGGSGARGVGPLPRQPAAAAHRQLHASGAGVDASQPVEADSEVCDGWVAKLGGPVDIGVCTGAGVMWRTWGNGVLTDTKQGGPALLVVSGFIYVS